MYFSTILPPFSTPSSTIKHFIKIMTNLLLEYRNNRHLRKSGKPIWTAAFFSSNASRCMKKMLFLLLSSKYRLFRGDLRKGTVPPHESKGWKKLHSKGITEEPTCRGFLMNLKQNSKTWHEWGKKRRNFGICPVAVGH